MRAACPTGGCPTPDPHAAAAAREKAQAAGWVAAGRLGKGELGAMVLEYLRTHTDDEVGPTVVARVLGRSQGAVANALTKLATSGHAELTSEAPRRYRPIHRRDGGLIWRRHKDDDIA